MKIMRTRVSSRILRGLQAQKFDFIIEIYNLSVTLQIHCVELKIIWYIPVGMPVQTLGFTSKNKKNCQIRLYKIRIVSCNTKQWSILKFVSLNIACRC